MLSNYTPAFVESYDAARRECRVRIPGLTDGAAEFPVATFCYPIGDKSEHTDIRVLPGDRVWVDFINNNPFYPVIKGYRPKESDNAIGVRRIHHDKVEITADDAMTLTSGTGDMTISSGGKIDAQANGSVLVKSGTEVLIEAGATVTIKAANLVFDGASTFTGPVTIQGLLTWLANSVGTGTAYVNGVRVGSDHNHTNVRFGTDISGPPQVP